MLIDFATLPDSVEDLKVLLVDLDAQYRARIEFLEERVRLFQKELFGRKTEKRPAETELRQLHLFNEAETLTEQESKDKPLMVPGTPGEDPSANRFPKSFRESK